jgi:hypothetical protein
MIWGETSGRNPRLPGDIPSIVSARGHGRPRTFAAPTLRNRCGQGHRRFVLRPAGRHMRDVARALGSIPKENGPDSTAATATV